MTTTPATLPTPPIRIAANNTLIKQLGNWTTAREFEVRAHRGLAVLDLRSPRIPAGDIHIHLDLNRATLKLLLPDDAVIDDWDLRRAGRGGVKDSQRATASGGRRIVVTGRMRDGEIRIHRGGIAILAAMWSRQYLADVRRANKEGGFPTVDDPTRTA